MLAAFSGMPQTPYTAASARTARVSCRSLRRRCCLLGEEEDEDEDVDDEDVVEGERERPAACRASSATCRVRSWHASVNNSGRQKKQPKDHHMRASW